MSKRTRQTKNIKITPNDPVVNNPVINNPVINNLIITDPYDPLNPINQLKPVEQENPYVEIKQELKQEIKQEIKEWKPSPELEVKLSKCAIKDIPEFSLNGIRTIGKVVDVYDGDTCKIILANCDILLRFNCRLKFVDTPEMKPLRTKPNRDIEIMNAMKCRNKLIQLTTNCKIELDDKLTKAQVKKILTSNNKVIQVQCHEFDKYGRLLVELYLGDKTVNNILVEEGFAKLYDGGTKDVFNY
jgi:endonuclease YncB( thermonuclease family)